MSPPTARSETQPAAAPSRLAAPVPGWYGCDVEDPAHFEDPYRGYRELRERQPVNLTPHGHWRISRYDDCVRVFRDLPTGMRLSNGLLPGQTEPDPSLGPGNFMLQQDPPNHTRLRKLVSKAFTPRAVDSWRGRVQAIVDDLLDTAAERGEMDLVADFARPVPATLICELLGVPVADRDSFTDWTADATHGLVTSRDLNADPALLERVQHAAFSLAGYFGELIAERRKQPGDDLLSVLIAAEEDGESLSEGELMSQSIGLLIAGFETTIGLIGNGLVELMRHPDELAKLQSDPTLIESVVEECLRYAGPITVTIRVMHADNEVGGWVIPKDSHVFLLIGGANRDPGRYPDPERFDVARYAGKRAATPHLSFGGGTHHCLGAHLARMESQVAIGSLVQRFRKLEMLSPKVEWGRSLFRVPGRLPIRFEVG